MAIHISDLVDIVITRQPGQSRKRLTPKAQFFKERKECRQILKRMYLDGELEWMRLHNAQLNALRSIPIRELNIEVKVQF